MSEPMPLMVAVTRGYATRGGSNDEFVLEWGLSADDEYAWSDATDKAVLLVIHGYENHPVDVVIEDALKNEEKRKISPDAVDKTAIRLFHHSASQGVAEMERGIGNGLGVGKNEQVNIQSHVYESGGGVAIEGLLRVMDETEPDLREVIEQAAAGRMLFANRLRRLQSGLLYLRLAMESARTGDTETAMPENTALVLDTARAVHETIERILDKDAAWLNNLGARQPETKTAIAAIKALYGPGYRPEESVWSGYETDENWLLLLDDGQREAARADLARFARALDVLSDAAELLPPRLPKDAGGKAP
uniref:Uncharacterized protein n=1 Tax=Candidatus Kentrum sp. FM TaxID=2126340 RepID=A0A450RXT3_9GAMM|nr:MAG: hypothetical protein BECKFM1743A_GA0114220_100073 [Candidatus Kentron sp. FM]VFJ43971.1 MAG: hypothetical protein BECKFM1743C_GA0114222_1000718 [Candidatus Kentron sp. FM]VFK06013.1 MAG: hypothetical protein BECKFM1743B_GA0114221_100093 [Candidatus Kentron sp. FM]